MKYYKKESNNLQLKMVENKYFYLTRLKRISINQYDKQFLINLICQDKSFILVRQF